MSENATFELNCRINGQAVSVTVPLEARLLDVLRYDCGLTGTKEGCGEGECGACTVLLDGLPVNACIVPAFQATGREIETVESTDADLAATLNRHGVSQCGACTPGIVMTTRWLLAHRDTADTCDLREFMSGNLCRCTGYDGVLEGLQAALQQDSD